MYSPTGNGGAELAERYMMPQDGIVNLPERRTHG